MNRSFLLAASLSGMLFLGPLPLQSATLTVTNTLDGDAEGTLRQIISVANFGDTIIFDVPLPAKISLTGGVIFLEADMTILGPGANKLIISGDGTNRVFLNDGVTVTISGITISNGVDRSQGVGGAIANLGVLTIAECTLKNNLARGPDGHGVGGGGGGAGGGAIFNDVSSTLFVVNSTFSDNQTVGGGGHRSGGGSGGAFGGAIFDLGGIVTLSNCTFAANLAMGGTSGVADDGEVAGNGGDGILSGSGGFGSRSFVDGSAGDSAFDIGGGGGAAADGEQGTGVCDGGNGGNGGAGAFGGGGGLGGNGATGCVVTNAGDGGNGGNGGNGGDGGFGAGGAGAGVGGQPTGIGTLTGSLGTNGIGGLGAGSGVSTNGGGGAGFGGAIFTHRGLVQIVNCTIASNSTAGGGSMGHVADGTGIGGGVYNYGGEFEVLNTIIAGNIADFADDVGNDATLGIDIVSDGHNLIGIGNGSSSFTNGVNGDLVGSTNAPLDAELGPLANNGGPTFTLALLAGSPAIDGGSDGNCLPTDQRGDPRPSGPRCDIGAFELDNPPVAICRNVTISLVSGCTTNVSIDNGSFEPDAGETITLSQSPPGPYPIGTNLVTLTATDGFGAANSCTGTVVILDNIPPTIACPSNVKASATSPAGVVVTFVDPTISDNCGATLACVPPSGSVFPIGDTTVLCTATDAAGNTSSCSFSVHVENASEQLVDAGVVILGQGIDPKIKKNVLKKFQSIEWQITANRTRNACKQLQALLRQVERELFKGHLTTEQAIQITTPLVHTLTVLGCP